MTGTTAGTGTFRCVDCDYVVALAPGADALPGCPRCSGSTFVRSSIFASGETVERPAAHLDDARADDAWFAQARESVEHAGEYVAYHEDDAVRVLALTREWTRIGRSLTADLRFDDPTVSRRHALVVRRADGLHVLDDRSLNGVFVNGERVERHALVDGDEVVLGRHRLRFMVVSAVTGARADAVAHPPPR